MNELKSVSIIGKASGHEDSMKYPFPKWGVNTVVESFPLDKCFDMHSRPNIENTSFYIKAKEVGAEVITLNNYPLEEIINHFDIDYFGSSVDYMIAYALYNNYNDLHLFGIRMVGKEEYIRQKASGDFWLGYALGLGCKVSIHHKRSTLLKTTTELLYGYLTVQKRWKGFNCNEATNKDSF